MEQLSLFDQEDRVEEKGVDYSMPLASRLRPGSLEEFVGQQHLLGEGKMLRQLIERDQISSMICEKTSPMGSLMMRFAILSLGVESLLIRTILFPR